ncbi:Paxillin [Leucoagaricus sp. SymC.cos]|nr:Paxillin [Leucoagaricus sp. SymC.cos]
MASLLAPTTSQPRASQVLPTVKCSSCSQPVPLAELGEHTCDKVPPVPSIPKLPSPPPPVNFAKPLPARVTSPGLPVAGPLPQRLATPPIKSPQSPHATRIVPPPTDHPRLSTGSLSPSLPQRSSPLAQHSRNNTSTSFQRARDFQPSPTLPLKPTLPTNPWPADSRGRSTSSASARPPISPTNSGPSHTGMKPLASPSEASPSAPPPSMPGASTNNRVVSFVPETEIGIDTKSGGEAGMAGVGRRGFAAAVRAATFVSPGGYHHHHYPQNRRPEPPRFLDIDAASRSTDTPPLSAGSGYSSHSPGPLSPGPHTDFIPEPFSKMDRTSSPSHPLASSKFPRLPSPVKSPVEEIASGIALSPLDRLPFFGKYKNALPGVSASLELYNDSHIQSPHDTSNNIQNDMNSGRSDEGPRLRNPSVSTITSGAYQRGINASLHRDSDSDSEYGLAYVDSSDEEGDAKSKGQSPSNKEPSSILRSDSTTTTRTDRVHFQGEAENGRSAAIAQALGISSNNRSGSGSGRQRSGSGSSVDTRSVYSRVTSIGGPIGKVIFEQTMETLVEDEVVIGQLPERSSVPRSIGDAQRHLRSESQDKGIGLATMSTSVQPHRSNTVQVPPHSPENKPPKLPTRAKTTNDYKSSMLEPPTTRKEKTRKTRVCLRCEKRIEDGRWIKVDTGGALCERCWKNMYLPKCRRCQKPIEKQAVSSSDGQLKGKYHKECFNCHVCHQSFPDKSFYVYDGKPLCAYHYHEANESLCAAARCGQPIEGPCAVSHTGDKYHPEHMTCEYPGSIPCSERLKEYWEVEGRMLCEKHAARAGAEEDDDEEWVRTSKAKKRVTRFMNLAGGVNGAGGELDDLL